MTAGDNDKGTAPQDNAKPLKEAAAALRTGQSAYDNGNYKLAEPLLLKALDAFEAQGALDNQEYFQCLACLADNYFHLSRYYEAKGFYERVSYARLKNPQSTDAQVVVALLKLASCQEKLGEFDDAINSFDLILELAQTTIPPGHALFGVIFDSFEMLVERHVDSPENRSERLNNLQMKREQFGFAQTRSGQWDALPNQLSEADAKKFAELPGTPSVLNQNSDELRHNLSAWTEPDLTARALDLRIRRAGDSSGLSAASGAAYSAAGSSSLDSATGVDEIDNGDLSEKHLHVHLTPDMFKRKPRKGDQSEVSIPAAEAAPAGVEEEQPRGGPQSEERMARSAKRLNTDKRPFNPLPILSVVAVLAVVGGSVFVAHEWTKTATTSRVVLKPVTDSVVSMIGKVYTSADDKKKLRFTTAGECEYVIGSDTVPGVYHIQGQGEKSSLSGLFNSGAAELALKESENGLAASDGTMLYGESGKDRVILAKVQSAAHFGTYYYATHEHLYPSSVNQNVAGSATITWTNPLTEQINAPVIEVKKYEDDKFEDLFVTTLKELRDSKPFFAVDDAAKARPGQIECLALLPGDDSSAKAGEAPCAFFIRAYDSEGKLFTAADGKKAYVVALKNGVSVDPVKASRETAEAPAASKYSFEITTLPVKK